MKKSMKIILGVAAVIFIIVVVFWGSIVYVSDYKITKVAVSVSPDGIHELILQAVGEADFPFGSATGRLILNEGKTRISKADFELFDDGGSIRSSIWEVTWHEDYVEVILSGDEQFDEQIILYFDGKKERKQLTDEETSTGAEDVNEIENVNEIAAIDSQADYISESESQKDIESDEKDVNLDDDIDSIEYINKYMIPEQSFDVTLDDWGEVKFVSCKPTYDISPQEYASFFLLRDEQMLYRFPYLDEDNTMGHEGSFDSIEAVAFRDINDDGKEDIIIIFNYVSGAGPTGMVPRPEIRIFLAGENEFYIAEDIMADVEKHIVKKDLTVDSIYQYLLRKDAGNGISEVNKSWQDAYKNIICNIESNLPDPYKFNSEFGCFNGDVYVGVHDFDNNEIPELIIGDASSVAIFTYERGKAEKVADLYEPEEWGGLNGLYYKDNQLVLISCGNGAYGGDGYVCFTYAQGEYITGFYCDYHPDESTFNGKPVSEEEFRQQFNFIEWKENSRIAYSKVNDENEIILAGTDEWIAIDNLDFTLIEW